DIRKEGSAYDLPIAIGILTASEQLISSTLAKTLIMGELSLDGSLLPVKGGLPIAIQAKKDGFERLIMPKENAREAAIVKDLEVYGLSHLKEVSAFLEEKEHFDPVSADPRSEFEDNLN